MHNGPCLPIAREGINYNAEVLPEMGDTIRNLPQPRQMGLCEDAFILCPHISWMF